MADDNTRAPSMFSGDLEDDNHLTNPGTRSSSLCSDDVPNVDPDANIAAGVLTQVGMTRGISPVTFVDRTQAGTILISEPGQLHIPRSIAEEDVERAEGTIATPTTPILDPMDDSRAHGQDLAEYVDHKFGLDGTETQGDTREETDNPGITFKVPVYHQDSDNDNTRASGEEARTEATLDPTVSRRISSALQDARSRISTFFPATDIVTSRRNSTEPSVSRRSRASFTLRRALGEQTLLARAVNRVIPYTSNDQSPARDDTLPRDRASNVRNQDSRASFAQTQQLSDPQTLSTDAVRPYQTNIIDRRLSEPAMSQTDGAKSVLSDSHRRRSLSGTGVGPLDDEHKPNEAQTQPESPPILQRAWQRLSTTLTSSSRFGSYDGTSAPPPTHEECPVSERYRSVDAEAVRVEQKSFGRLSRASTRLRHIGSSTLTLARRGFPVFSAFPALDRDVHDAPATGSSVRDYAETPMVSNATIPDSFRELNEAEPALRTEDIQHNSRLWRRGLIRSEWRHSMRVVSAPFRRQNTLIPSTAPEQTGYDVCNADEYENEGSQNVSTDDNANNDMHIASGKHVIPRTKNLSLILDKSKIVHDVK